MLDDRDRGTKVPLLLHVEYWLALLLILLYDDGLGDREIKTEGTCLLASSAIEPVSTEVEEELLL